MSTTHATERDAEPRTMVAVRGVSKVFGSTRALSSVDMTIAGGEVHALVGGNGSGKSTLVKILCGVIAADRGTVRIGDREVDLTQIVPELAYDLGVRVVHQDLALFPDLTVAENIMLGGIFPTLRSGGINRRQMNREAAEAIERYEIAAHHDDLLRTLPVSTGTEIAIARALRGLEDQSALILFDEATAALPVHEVSRLHETIRRLASHGHAILYISHRLDEVLALTDRVTVLKDGSVVADHPTSDLTEGELIEAMLGRGTHAHHTHKPVEKRGRPLLTVSSLCAGPLRDVTLEVRSGEVVGVAGLLGSGRTELLRALCGDLEISAGSVTFDDRPRRFRSIGEAIREGVVMIPEDRVNSGVFPDLTVDDNMGMSVLREYWAPLGFKQGQIRKDGDDLIGRFGITPPSGTLPVSALSGGNQQKTVLARWLRRKPSLILLDEPTQGVDVGARADIHALIRQATDAGSAALLVASDLEELAQVVDRAIVLSNGRLIAEVPHEQLSPHYLTELVTKVKAAA